MRHRFAVIDLQGGGRWRRRKSPAEQARWGAANTLAETGLRWSAAVGGHGSALWPFVGMQDLDGVAGNDLSLPAAGTGVAAGAQAFGSDRPDDGQRAGHGEGYRKLEQDASPIQGARLGFEGIKELRQAFQDFKKTYNQTWIIERHRYQTTAQVRDAQIGHIPMAA